MNWAAFLTVACLLAALQATAPKQRKTTTNKAPVIAKFQSSDTRVWTCGERMYCEGKKRWTVSLEVEASDPDRDPLTYEYAVTGGELIGEGTSVSWKLGDQKLGKYSATVKVSDSKGASTSATLEVIVSQCASCWFPDPPCPVIAMYTHSDFTKETETYRGEWMDFLVKISGVDFQTRPDYVWTIENGKILKGQHTPRIRVETTGDVGKEVVARVEVVGFDTSCSTTAETRVPILK